MRQNRAFTLIELLVVIAIIGTLVALLLPAVNIAREQGRLTVCKGNLGQLSKACLEHVNKIGCFPSGGWGSNWVGLPDQGSSQSQPGGWIYQLLPYMDQDQLHDLGKGSLATSASASAVRVETALSILICPTRHRVATYPVGAGVSGANPASPMLTTAGITMAGRTDYAANGGSYYVPNGIGPGSIIAAATYTWPSLANFNGIVAVHSAIPVAGVTDNKDTCYLFGEKYMSPENYITGQDPGDQFSDMAGDDLSMIRWSCLNCIASPTAPPSGTVFAPSMDRVAANSPPTYGTQTFGSSHPAGWCAAFVGGNVQLIGWGLNTSIHVAMSTRNGHEVIDASQIPR